MVFIKVNYLKENTTMKIMEIKNLLLNYLQWKTLDNMTFKHVVDNKEITYYNIV